MNGSIDATAVVGAAIHPELSRVMMTRAMEQFGLYLSKSGPDAKPHKFTLELDAGGNHFVPVNTPVSHGQKMNLGGMEVTFYTEGVATDTNAQVVAHIKDEDIVMNNIVWMAMPNLYATRGGAYRNPTIWRDALDWMASTISYILDQTLRGVNEGKHVNAIAQEFKLPKYLEEDMAVGQDYGKLANMIPAIIYAALGPYIRNAAELTPIHPDDEAGLMIKALGGMKATQKIVKDAQEAGDYAFAANLATHLINIEDSQYNKQLKADALRQMGYRTFSTNSRSWYLGQALQLEGKINILTSLPANSVQVTNTTAEHVDYYRIRVNVDKPLNVDNTIGFQFTDGTTASLNVRGGIAKFSKLIDQSDVVVSMDNAAFTMLFNNTHTIEDMFKAGLATGTDNVLASKILDYFDVQYDWENDPALQDLAKILLAQ